jgi:hypothetical protein
MNTVFVLEHLRVRADGWDDVKLIGVYRSRATAMAAVERLRLQPGFREYPKLVEPLLDDEPSGFYLEEYALDEDHWTEGFVGGEAEG